jgi:hypothetical protein
MQYMLMLYEKEQDWDTVAPERREAALAEHEKFVRMLRERGIAFSGAALRPSTAATTLRPSPGGMIVSDGPYVELKEHIGGFYTIDAPDLDAAIEIARQCPTGTGTEIRPMWGTSD